MLLFAVVTKDPLNINEGKDKGTFPDPNNFVFNSKFVPNLGKGPYRNKFFYFFKFADEPGEQ